MRLEGKSYMEIMAAGGGGIAATVNATRKASLDELVAQAMERAQRAFAHGTTTMEAKSGYGLDLETEFRQLEAVLEINKAGTIELVPTYMGAHAIPVEFKGDTAGYTRWLCEVALPETKSWWLKHAPGQALPFVDVFFARKMYSKSKKRVKFSKPHETLASHSNCMLMSLRTWVARVWELNLAPLRLTIW